MSRKKDLAELLGLPEELIEPEAFTRELQKIKIRREKRKFGKIVTIVEGFDETVDLKSLTKKLKKKLGCGGTYYDDRIELQGDHARKVKEILVQEGFPEENISVV